MEEKYTSPLPHFDQWNVLIGKDWDLLECVSALMVVQATFYAQIPKVIGTQGQHSWTFRCVFEHKSYSLSNTTLVGQIIEMRHSRPLEESQEFHSH